MTDGNGNGNSAGTGAIYAAFDRKLEGIERDLRQDFQNYRTETNNSFSDFRSEIKSDMAGLRSSVAEVLSKLGGSSRPAVVSNGGGGMSNTSTFVSVGASIIVPICVLGAYVVSNLDTKMTTITSELDKKISDNTTTIFNNEKTRSESVRIIYDKLWAKESQVEYERRVDERNVLDAHFQDQFNTQILGDIKTVVANMVPRVEHEQRWLEQKEGLASLERTLGASISRLGDHVNQGDANVAAKFSDVDKSLHGYGIADEMKDIQTQLRDTQDKLFHLATPASPIGPPTSAPSQ